MTSQLSMPYDYSARVDVRRIAACLLIFVAAVLVRLWYVENFAVALPFWDQWDSEGYALLRPWIDGNLPLNQFWQPHNEHRVLPTRLMTLLSFQLTGHWNNLAESRLNIIPAAVLPSLLMWLLFKEHALRGAKWLMLPVLLAGAVLPFGWENFLVGFQGQYYFLLLFAVGALALAVWRPDGAIPTLIVLVLSVLSILTMASGLITPLAVACVYGAGWFLRRTHPLRTTMVIALLITLAIIAYGMMPVVPGHAELRARGVIEIMDATIHVLGWPIVGYHWAMVIFWFLGSLVILAMLMRRSLTRTDLLMAGCFAWSVAQGLAVACYRGHGLLEISSRYADLLVIGMVANAWFALRLIEEAGQASRIRAASIAVASIFFLAFFVGHAYRIEQDIGAMTERHALALIQTANVSRYLTTHDPAALRQPFLHIPYPDAARLQQFLDDPTLHAILPAMDNAAASEPQPLPQPNH